MARDYKDQVIKRTVQARKDAGYKTQEDIAAALGIGRERYAKYETERIIHKELIARFCQLTHVTENWLLTGMGQQQDQDLLGKIRQLNADNYDNIMFLVDSYLQKQTKE